ncbi:MAG TPA: hypothetical protein VD998_03720, partial [Verrucomicrobiae bacterium]|nr:hypothetical protein [Verrucomicrobiae bacterium]
QLSSNNWCDVDRALQTITHIAAGYNLNFGQVPYIAVGIKHGNACGAAVSNDPLEAIKRMIGGDPRAIFGGTVITNFPIDAKHATFLRELRVEKTKRILDLVMAPEFSGSGCEILRRKEGRCRMLANPELGNLTVKSLDSTPRIRQVRGGFLRQGNYTYVLDLDSHSMVKFGKADEESLLLGWAVGCTSNSNTITLTRDRMLIGNGTGQMDRVGAAELAIKKAVTAGHETAGCVAYSDSFFPFRDGPDVLADAGVAAILSTSGSERDEEVRTACKERKVALYMIPDSIARGFYAH